MKTEGDHEYGDRTAKEGHLFVCCACGKISETRYGIDGKRSRGWDESCMLNAREFPTDSLVWNDDKTRVVEVKA